MSVATPLETKDKLITADELYTMGDLPGAELIEGKLSQMSPTGFEYGIREARIARSLSFYCEQHNLGEVMTGQVGIYIRRNPDSSALPCVKGASNVNLESSGNSDNGDLKLQSCKIII